MIVDLNRVARIVDPIDEESEYSVDLTQARKHETQLRVSKDGKPVLELVFDNEDLKDAVRGLML